MASNKFIELQEFSDDELREELQATQVQQQKLQFDHVVKGLDNPHDLREIRRDIARLKTEIRRRELANLSDEALADRDRLRARRRKRK